MIALLLAIARLFVITGLARAQEAPTPASERTGGIVALVTSERTGGTVALVNGGLDTNLELFEHSDGGERIVLQVPLESKREVSLGDWTGTTTRIDLDATTPHPGNDRHWADQLESARMIVLSGGDSKSWFTLLMPGGTRSALGRAIQSAHRAGVCVVAQGAAAPLLGEWALIDTALFSRVQRNPRQTSTVVVFRGLDLVHGMCIESSDASSGSLARCLASALDAHAALWLYLEGPVAWIDSGARGSCRTVGTGTTIVLDLKSARRDRNALRTGRITLLSSAGRSLLSSAGRLDPWHGEFSTVLEPAPIETSEPPRSEHLAQAIDAQALLRGVAHDHWIQDGRRIELLTPELRLTLWTDERSRFPGASSPDDASFALVAFDLERAEP